MTLKCSLQEGDPPAAHHFLGRFTLAVKRASTPIACSVAGCGFVKECGRGGQKGKQWGAECLWKPEHCYRAERPLRSKAWTSARAWTEKGREHLASQKTNTHNSKRGHLTVTEL